MGFSDYRRGRAVVDIEALESISADDILNIKGGVVVNEGAENRDFRVESQSDTHALFVDASTSMVGVGTSGPAATLDVDGSVRVKRTAVTASTYTVTATDYIVGVDTSSNTVTLTLPAASTAGAGRIIIVKDEGNNAATNNITIDGNSSETIDGSTTSTISGNRNSVTLYCNGSGWNIV